MKRAPFRCPHLPKDTYSYPEGIQCTIEDRSRFDTFCNVLCNLPKKSASDIIQDALLWKRSTGLAHKQFVVYLECYCNIHNNPQPENMDDKPSTSSGIAICVKSQGIKRDIPLGELIELMRISLQQNNHQSESSTALTTVVTKGDRCDEVD
jgi:hypothetical protein